MRIPCDQEKITARTQGKKQEVQVSIVGELIPNKGIHPVYLGMTIFEVLTALNGWKLEEAINTSNSFDTKFSNGTMEIEISFYLIDDENNVPKIMCLISEHCVTSSEIPYSEMNITKLEQLTTKKLAITEEYEIDGKNIIHAEFGGLQVRQEGNFITEISLYDTTE